MNSRCDKTNLTGGNPDPNDTAADRSNTVIHVEFGIPIINKKKLKF
jgi:hypothetical protein